MKFALRLLLRDIRSGDTPTLLIALIISISTVTAIGLFIDRLQGSFETESATLMAADRLISSDDDFSENWFKQAEQLSLIHAKRVSFSTMIFANEQLQLSQVSAVSSSYPLKGEFLVDDQLFGAGYPVAESPAENEIWLSSRLASALNTSIGEWVEVGETRLQVSHLLVRDPGSTASAFAVSPRAVMNLADLAATQVIIPGSRVNYSLMLAGEPESLEEYENWVTPQLEEGQRWRTPIQQGEQIGDTINKAQSFLLLAGTLAVTLSGVAMALASARYVRRHQMQLAILKTMGATPKGLTRLFGIQFSLLFLMGLVIGLLLGWVLQGLFAAVIADIMSTNLPAPSLQPIWLGAATGFIAMLAFCLPLLQGLIRTSPMSVLQPSMKLEQNGLLIYAVGLLGMYGLMCLYTQGFLLPSIMLLAIAVIALIVGLMGWVLFKLGRTFTSGATNGWQIGFASLYRRKVPNLFQLLVFTLIIMLGLIMMGLQTSLISDWQKQLPDNAPNHYLFNVQSYQLEGLNTELDELNIQRSNWYPMVRGRVMAVNEEEISEKYAESDYLPDFYSRELNLTWSDQIGNGNELIKGDFNAEGLSIEEGVALEAGLSMGDIIRLNIGGKMISLPITSVRRVDWGSMQPNFYLILPRTALEDYPANFVSSAYIDTESSQRFYQVMANFPTVSVLNVSDVLKRIQTVIGQLSQAIQLVLVCILLASGLVLLASVRATLEERLKEGALLRVLGAGKSLIRQSMFVEFGALGLFSGLIAAAGSEACLYALQVWVFKSPASWHPLLWALGPLAGISIIAAIGLFAGRTVIRVPPMHLLRG